MTDIFVNYNHKNIGFEASSDNSQSVFAK